jgi:hypothetical protein
MFQLEAMPRQVETATVGHFRHAGFMHPDLRGG